MKEVKIAVIGVGNIGSAHARSLFENKVDGGRLAALCDLSPEKRKFCEESFPGIPVFSSCEELFASGTAEAVIISVPHPLHAALCIKAFQANLHVLCEKPIDISVKRALELNRAAQNSGRVFAIMFNQRTDPIFQKAKEIVQSGQLGELKRSVWIITNWYRDQSYYDSGDWRATWSGEGGGVLLNQAPHNLDLWQWICGMPVSLRAECREARYHSIEVEDEALLHVRYANGATGTFLTSTGEYPGTNRLEISGTLGKLVLENSTLKWWKLPADERKFCFDPAIKPHSADVVYEEVSFPPHHGAHRRIIENFCAAITKGEKLISPGTDGICQLSLTNAAYLSQWKSEEVSLPLDAEEYERYLEKKIDSSKKIGTSSFTSPAGEYKSRWQVNW